MSIIRWTLLALALAPMAPRESHATLLAYEGYTGYTDGQLLAGKSVAAGTTGVSGSIGGIGQSNDYSASAAGLTFSNVQVSGGKAVYSDNAGTAAGLTYNYSGSSVTGTLYTGFLLNISSGLTVASSAGLRVNTSQNASGSTGYFQSYADTSTGTTPGSAYGLNASLVSSSAPTTTAGNLALGTTYLVIGIFTNVGTALSTESPGIGTTYILTSSQFDYFMAHGGLTDAALAAASVGATGDNTIFSAVSSSVTTGQYNFTTGSGLQFAIGNAQTLQTAYFDEMRIGTSLADIAPIPEPSTVGLTLIALGSLLMVRRRR